MTEPLTTPVKILVQVITGGRPELRERYTAKYLEELSQIATVEWCIREDHVAAYEKDDHPFNVYTTEFANEFARTHWRHPKAEWKPGGFFGAFPGREWACRSAAERGYDAVLQLDDNITDVGPIAATKRQYVRGITSTSELVALLAEFQASTNASMLGFQLSSVIPRRHPKIMRPGYPYSIFMEKVGPGRLPYYGPFEDDIMHALEYSLNGGPGRTAAVMDTLTYRKDSQSKSGMRGHYNPQRGLEIARRYPRNAKLVEGPRTSSPTEKERGVRHVLNTRGFTPVRINDAERFARAEERLRDIISQGKAATRVTNRDKIMRRADNPV